VTSGRVGEHVQERGQVVGAAGGGGPPGGQRLLLLVAAVEQGGGPLGGIVGQPAGPECLVDRLGGAGRGGVPEPDLRRARLGRSGAGAVFEHQTRPAAIGSSGPDEFVTLVALEAERLDHERVGLAFLGTGEGGVGLEVLQPLLDLGESGASLLGVIGGPLYGQGRVAALAESGPLGRLPQCRSGASLAGAWGRGCFRAREGRPAGPRL
jgi:hypothetical protein